MVCVIYRHKNLQEKNENMRRIITLQFRFVLFLVKREGRENKQGFSGNSNYICPRWLLKNKSGLNMENVKCWPT